MTKVDTPKRAVTRVVPISDPPEDRTTPPRATAVQLVCVAGPDLGRTFSIDTAIAVIGRGAVDVALQSGDISRQHARIAGAGSEFTIADLGSSNGTYVNGARVNGSAPLVLGDRVQVGTTILVFQRRDELEERMRTLQRLEAMGTMAGGLAHDFKNALAVILGNVEAIRERIVNDAEAAQILDEITVAASSATDLANRLLRLGRSEPMTYASVRLGGLVDRAMSTMRRQPGPKLDLSAEIEPQLEVAGSFEELHQVLLNLYLNARDAMPDGGVFRIAAHPISFDAQHAHERHLPGPGDYIELTVSDTGTGMDAQTLARIFEPFFTTKPATKGTGLGLAMVHGIVRRHGGAIDVESIPMHGTTFRIMLPSAAKRR